jgi:hypothetical protein
VSFLEELIRTVQEAVDEANGRPPRTATPAPRQVSLQEELAVRDRLRRRAEEAHRHEAEQNRRNERAAHVVEQAAHDARMVVETPRTTSADKPPSRVAALLRNPATVRDAIILREVLDRPLALRRR